MREPTKEMRDASMLSDFLDGPLSDWRAMIDAAISG
jgi:hypothetical protein